MTTASLCKGLGVSSVNDLEYTHVYYAREMGFLMVVSTDTHSVDNLENMRYGVAVAYSSMCLKVGGFSGHGKAEADQGIASMP